MIINLPEDVVKIIETLEQKGHQAYIVGGCVRDSIMGTLPKDWDITTSARPEEVMELFPKSFGTGVKHGTITVLINRHGYEVTTYRIDGEYSDNRRPDKVIFTSNIIEDLSRRDFTVNAIAYNPAKGFVDPFDGRNDIDKKLIRCVGIPRHRFGEDALRMLRALRFAGQLGFFIDKATLRAIAAMSLNIANISAERIREELVRLLCSPYVKAIKLLETTGLLCNILEYSGDIDKTTELLAACPEKETLRLAVFFAYSGHNSLELLRSLRFDNKTIREVFHYICMLHTPIPHDRYEIKKILRQIPHELFENLLLLQSLFYPDDTSKLAAIRIEVQDILDKEECYTLQNLSVKGKDLITAGFPPGKAVGDKLEGLLDMVMRNPELNDSLHDFV
ncbi:MAG: CCA tRNA nucleotidyltransferase [Defluviitaleaceae bacterium]|nr:CCA tRNA nucleotidyltransferase [Defluviitaleaceae bacterium]